MASVEGPLASGKKQRPGIVQDLTPMVDVAFLLLTFFMLTTVFSRPQAMEINLPESDSPVEIAESNMLTVRVAQDGGVYWNIARNEPERTDMDGIHDVLVRQTRANDKLVTLVKVDREANYVSTVDILDELALADVTRFALAPMTTDDVTVLQGVGAPVSPVEVEAAPAAAAPAASAAP